MLTEQAKKDFLDYIKHDSILVVLRIDENNFFDLPIITQVAYVIEWFDSLGVHVETVANYAGDKVRFITFYNGIEYGGSSVDRLGAILQGIKIANNVYNDDNKKHKK